MPVPYLAGALRGWTRKIQFKIVTKTVANNRVSKTTETVTLNCNLQPMPQQRVNKKPEEQRSWRWWSLIVKEGPILKPDDTVTDPYSRTFTIMGVNDWTESGFQKYEAVQNFGT